MMVNIREQLQNCIGQGSSDVRAALEVAGICQNKCFYCYAKSLRNQGIMSAEVFNQSVEALSGLGFREVYVVGGEPMTNPDIVNICQQLHQRGLSVILVTNGFKLNDESLVRQILPYIDQVEISIRGPDAHVHDRISEGMGPFEGPLAKISSSFTQAIEALKTINRVKQDTNLPVTIAINHDLYQHSPDPQGHGSVYQIAKLLVDQGITLNGFYLQLDSDENHQLISVYGQSPPDEQTLRLALKDLKTIRKEYGIEDIGVIDNPEDLDIVRLSDLSSEDRELCEGEEVLAISPVGKVRRNVVVA